VARANPDSSVEQDGGPHLVAAMAQALSELKQMRRLGASSGQAIELASG